MIRATLTAAALCACALSSGAQNPTPAPTKTTKPTGAVPAPKAKRPPARVEWSSPDLMELEDKLNSFRDMQLEMPPMPPMPPIEPMDWVEMPMDPAFPMDIDFDLAPHMYDIDMGFDMMPDVPPMPAFPPMAEIEMDWADVAPVPPVAMVPATPMVPMTPMTPMVVEPMLPMTPPAPGAFYSGDLDRARAEIARVQGQSPFERQFGGIANDPPQAWAQSDPADSLYRLARQALNRGEYRRAAELFGNITQKFPNSAYAADARYWRAFALYRLGGSSDLREALNALQDSGRNYRQASLQTDAPVLATRIRGALAAQGDGPSIKAVNMAATQPGEACDKEDLAVRVEALNSLGQTDPESTTPILRRLLARRDECSASLRRAAIYLLGRRTDAEALNLVMGAARNDPDMRVRSEALRFLAAMPGDQAIGTIEEMARTPGNPELQRAAVAALGRSDSPRARQSLRAIAERTDIDENLRITALSSIDADRAADNGAYLRGLYPRLETPRLKAAAIRSAARSGGNDNDQWLLSIVRNQSEPVEVRALALRYAGRSGLSISDLTKMYDVAGDRPLREQLINLYAQRPEPEATDKLMNIARTGTDPDLRRYAISALSRKNDPRTKKLLLEIIDR